MFTGLVVARGRLIADPTPTSAGGSRLEISHPAELGRGLEIGASVAVSGVCLTVVAGDANRSSFDLAPETLARTTLGALRAGDEVNLEPALRMGQAMGGHWVQGHVDGVVEVVALRDLADSSDVTASALPWNQSGSSPAHRELRFSLPPWAVAGIVEKGSVTLDGVSLTVSALADPEATAAGLGWFEVALIPHTLTATTLGERQLGDRLNLEIDVLAKYIEKYLERALIARGLPSTASTTAR